MAFLYQQFKKIGGGAYDQKIVEHHSKMPYYSSLESLQKYGKENNLEFVFQEMPSTMVLSQCASLSDWIYGADTQLHMKRDDEFNYKKIVIANKSTQVAQWAFLQSDTTKTAFLVFKGTDINNPQDILTDLGMIPSPPLYPTDGGDPEISAHGTMYIAMTRDYKKIKQEIESKLDNINNLYITGHSLGGGLSKIFGLKGIIDGFIPLKQARVQIITFGAPSVIVIEKEIDKLSSKSKEYLDLLNNVTHCVVNRFDIVPRVLSSVGVKWINFVTKASYEYMDSLNKKIMQQSHEVLLTQNMSKEEINGMKDGVKYGLNEIKTNILGLTCQSLISLGKEAQEIAIMGKNKYKDNTDIPTILSVNIAMLTDDEYKYEHDEKQNNEETQKEEKDIFGSLQNVIEAVKENAKHNLLLYHPFGTYYIHTSECEACLVTNNGDQIKQILSYIPSRLSFNIETMQMLLANHSMTEYNKLFKIQTNNKHDDNNDDDGKQTNENNKGWNCPICTFWNVTVNTKCEICEKGTKPFYNNDDKNNPEFYIYGYMNKLKSEIWKGQTCGGGDMFWVKHHSKCTPIGQLSLEKHIGGNLEIISSIRQKAAWSSHDFQWRIVFHIWGYHNYIEIAAGNSEWELRKIFHKY